ncbi:MAG: TadE/TadG family type IV pilus assembly protein [Bacillota bacterium]
MKEVLKAQRGSITLEFALCGIMFMGFVLGMVVMGLWMYNVSQVNQAARIAAYTVALTGDAGDARNKALLYLNKTLLACPAKNAAAFSSRDSGYGVAEAEMNPLFPGFIKLIDAKGTSAINGRILIRKEALSALAHKLRPENRDQYN